MDRTCPRRGARRAAAEAMTRLDEAVDVRRLVHDVRTQIEAGVPVCELADDVATIVDVCAADPDPRVAVLAMLLRKEVRP